MRFFLITMALFLCFKIHGQSVVINELMASNQVTIQDEDGDYSDWIELYNVTDNPINLSGYSLSDNQTKLEKWTFPSVTISPKGYLLVFASGKNQTDGAELHTNFKISSSGEKLFLSNDFGEVIDWVQTDTLSADESYSRVPDGSERWLTTRVSSPNATNNFSNQLTFSKSEGFYTEPFFLYIHSLTGDTVYYTLNGDLPDENSISYDSLIFILDLSFQPNRLSEIPTSPPQNLISYKAWESPKNNVDKATILRCASFRNGVRTSQIYTKTFFVNHDITYKYTVPVISIVTEEENLFDKNKGLLVPGINYMIDDPEWSGNYFMSGENWEREAHIEYFSPKGKIEFSQDAGMRIHGGKTRQAAQKSLRFYARAEYGTKHFDYPLLSKRNTEKYKHFILQTTMGAWNGETIIKDIVGQQISSSLNVDYQEFQPVVVYLNGEYWGIYTIRDRIDEKYIEYIHDINDEDVEFFDWNNDSFNQLRNFIEKNSLESNDNYEYVKSQIDIDNYIDYTIAEQFLNNYDWPANNMRFWKERDKGKWRWVLYDLDAGFGNPDYNMLLHSTKNDPQISWPNTPYSTFLFRNLLLNYSFRTQYLNRYAELLNNEFNVEVMRSKSDSVQSLYEPEVLSHIQRWNYPTSLDSWEEDIKKDMLVFLENRPCAVSNQIKLFFDMENFGFDCISKIPETISTTQLMMMPNPNNGRFFIDNNVKDIAHATIFISDMNGKIVYTEKEIQLLKNENKYMNVSHLPSGVYVLKLMSENYTDQMKFIKVH
ncbi:MAG: CotH kinase family protein [Chitinophagales bacterium]|nr:CotH kinase family protein [Chitinophagales bacterium]